MGHFSTSKWLHQGIDAKAAIDKRSTGVWGQFDLNLISEEPWEKSIANKDEGWKQAWTSGGYLMCRVKNQRKKHRQLEKEAEVCGLWDKT